MTSGMVDCDGQRIAFRASTGQGPSVLLIHGNSSSSGAYARQIEGEIGRTLRLVALDLPGHGASDRARDPSATYTLPGYARIIRTFVEHLDLREAVIVGWSLGGHIALEAAPDLPDAKGFLVFGTPPLAVPANLADSFFDHPAMAHGFTATLTSEQALAYAASFFRPGADVPTPFHTDVMNTDGVARAQIAASIVPDGYRDEVKVVAGMDRPLAILHGTQEQLVNGRFFTGLAMPTLWRGAVQELTGAGHAPQWETPDEFDALLGAFVADCQRI